MIGVKFSDRERDDVKREKCVVKKDVVTKIEKNVFRWFVHVEKIDEFRIIK
jgi:hypothetical protein